MNIDIRSLENTEITDLHSTWVEAFSDYFVSIQLSVSELESHFRQNGVDMRLSFGAFADGKLVGFWMNGIRDMKGRTIAYDSGTGIIPSFRKKGISKRLSQYSERRLAEHGVSECILEVIQSNQVAYRTYLEQGYLVSRTLECFRTDTASLIERTTDAELLAMPFKDYAAKEYPEMEFNPSWQNSTSSCSLLSGELQVVEARRRNQVVGFGVIHASRDRIMQLGFSAEEWETPTPAALLWKLCSATTSPKLYAINIDSNAQRTIRLLKAQGFVPHVSQFEMNKMIG